MGMWAWVRSRGDGEETRQISMQVLVKPKVLSGLSAFRFIIELLVSNLLDLFISLAIISKTNFDLKEVTINERPLAFYDKP